MLSSLTVSRLRGVSRLQETLKVEKGRGEVNLGAGLKRLGPERKTKLACLTVCNDVSNRETARTTDTGEEVISTESLNDTSFWNENTH